MVFMVYLPTDPRKADLGCLRQATGRGGSGYGYLR